MRSVECLWINAFDTQNVSECTKASKFETNAPKFTGVSGKTTPSVQTQGSPIFAHIDAATIEAVDKNTGLQQSASKHKITRRGLIATQRNRSRSAAALIKGLHVS